MGDKQHCLYLEDPGRGLWLHHHSTLISVQLLLVNIEPSSTLSHFPALGHDLNRHLHGAFQFTKHFQIPMV